MSNLSEKHRDVMRRSEADKLVPEDATTVAELVARKMLNDAHRLTAKGCAYMAAYGMDVRAALARINTTQLCKGGNRYAEERICD